VTPIEEEKIAAAAELLADCDTSDYEDCTICNALDDICLVHKAQALGSQQLTGLIQFVLADPEWAWVEMQDMKRRRAEADERIARAHLDTDSEATHG
jgi:hypothetical protein